MRLVPLTIYIKIKQGVIPILLNINHRNQTQLLKWQCFQVTIYWRTHQLRIDLVCWPLFPLDLTLHMLYMLRSFLFSICCFPDFDHWIPLGLYILKYFLYHWFWLFFASMMSVVHVCLIRRVRTLILDPSDCYSGLIQPLDPSWWAEHCLLWPMALYIFDMPLSLHYMFLVWPLCCPPPFAKAGEIKTHSSVCPSVRLSFTLSVCHKKINLAHIFWSINDRALIFSMHKPCDKSFRFVPCGDLDLWPTSRSNLLPGGGPQFFEFACFICWLFVPSLYKENYLQKLNVYLFDYITEAGHVRIRPVDR